MIHITSEQPVTATFVTGDAAAAHIIRTHSHLLMGGGDPYGTKCLSSVLMKLIQWQQPPADACDYLGIEVCVNA